jgi:hypothetical protein
MNGTVCHNLLLPPQVPTISRINWTSFRILIWAFKKLPTRGDSILDLVISKDPDLVSDIDCIQHLATSDHAMVSCLLHIDCEAMVDNKTYLDYNSADYDGMRNELRHTNWSVLM